MNDQLTHLYNERDASRHAVVVADIICEATNTNPMIDVTITNGLRLDWFWFTSHDSERLILRIDPDGKRMTCQTSAQHYSTDSIADMLEWLDLELNG